MAKKRGGRRQLQWRTQQVSKPQPVLSQQQSTETVQVMLFSSISMLFHERKLFPGSAYDGVVLEDQTEPPLYDDFVSGKVRNTSINIARDDKEEHIDMPEPTAYLLRKGRSGRVDSFLHILESGVFDALRRKVLSAVQIDVLADVENRSRVLETYTFTIKWKESDQSNRHVEGVQFGSFAEDSTQDDRIHDSLIPFLEQVDDQLLSAELAPLPADPYMLIYLQYVNDYNDNYEPPGFEKTSDNEIVFPVGNGWQKRTENFSAAGGYFHDISLNVSYLKHESRSTKRRVGIGAKDMLRCSRFDDLHLSDVHNASTPLDQATSISDTNDLQPSNPLTAGSSNSEAFLQPAMQVMAPSSASQSADTDIGLVMDLDLDVRSGEEICHEISHQPRPDKVLMAVDLPTLALRPYLDRKDLTTSTQQIDLSNTEASMLDETESQMIDDARMTKALQDILLPEHATQYSVPTQRNHDNTQEEMQVAQEKQVDEALESHVNKFNFLVRERAVCIWKSQSRLEHQRHSRESIVCHCEFKGVEGATIGCEVCGAEQHMQCYGYLGFEDPRRPAYHVCYGCLLGDNKRLVAEVKGTVMLRQALHVILSENLLEQAALAERFTDFGIGSTVTASLVQQLLASGHVMKTRHTQRHSQSQDVDKIRIQALDQGKRPKEKLLELFDPFLHISQYYTDDCTISAGMRKGDAVYRLLVTRYPALAPANHRRQSTQPKRRPDTGLTTRSSTGSAPFFWTAEKPAWDVNSADPMKRHQGDVAQGYNSGVHEDLFALHDYPAKRARSEVSPRPAQRSTPRGALTPRYSASRMPINVSSVPTPDRASTTSKDLPND